MKLKNHRFNRSSTGELILPRESFVRRLFHPGSRVQGASLLVGAICWLASHPSAPAQPFTPPPMPDVAPLIGQAYASDANRDRIDDRLSLKIATANTARLSASTQMKVDQAQAALAALVDVELVFQTQITQKQIDAFLAQGGQIAYIYQAVSYGWNGRIPLGKAAALPALMGASLVLIHEAKPMKLHMDTATRTGRVRPIWASGFAGKSGFSGNTNITIGIVDTGVDESHPDLTGRRVYWRDFTPDALPSPGDLNQHGSHVAGIALGTGSAGGKGTNLFYTDKGTYDTTWSNYFALSTIELPATTVKVTLTATWKGGGSTTLRFQHHTNGTSGDWNYYEGQETNGPSPLTLTLPEYYPVAGLGYSAALFGNGSNMDYVVKCKVEGYTGPGDDFNNFRGVAPDCSWAGAKVFADSGTNLSTWTGAAVDALVVNRKTNNIKVMNLSLAAIAETNGTPGIDEDLRQKINTAVDNGIVVAVAAGNEGGKTEVSDPGRAAMALTVAAANDVNQVTDYTCMGFEVKQSAAGQEEDYKPDLMAPGGSTYYSDILSVDSNTGDGPQFADQQANDYYNIHGTSMASPFAGGCAALVIDALQQAGTTWDFNSSKHSRYVKMVLCATASESNANRESATNNPTLQRAANGPAGFPASKDKYEGYGMINPDAAVEAVSQTYTLGSMVTNTLGAGVADRRVWARTVALLAGQSFAPLLAVPATGDFALYLYSATPSAYGTPILLASSTTATNGGFELLNYQPVTNGNALLVVKRVSGSGLFGLYTGVQLSLALAGNQVVISWPASAVGWQLQTNTTLATGWQDVATTPEIVGDYWTVSVPRSYQSQFFLLRKAPDAAPSAKATRGSFSTVEAPAQ